MLKRFRERAGSESGFTLIELLVVMLILGILAAIAIPAFLNQKGKANDSAMKVQARTMQTAMETCATDSNTVNPYINCSLTQLHKIEPTIPSTGPTVDPTVGFGTAYTVESAAATTTGNKFKIAKQGDGTVVHSCTTENTGGCPTGGNW